MLKPCVTAAFCFLGFSSSIAGWATLTKVMLTGLVEGLRLEYTVMTSKLNLQDCCLIKSGGLVLFVLSVSDKLFFNSSNVRLHFLGISETWDLSQTRSLGLDLVNV